MISSHGLCCETKSGKPGFKVIHVCPSSACFLLLFLLLFLFTWDDSVNEESQRSQANSKGFPGTNSLMSPPKDVKENLLNF